MLRKVYGADRNRRWRIIKAVKCDTTCMHRLCGLAVLATLEVVAKGVQGRRMLGHDQQEHQRQASQPAQGGAAAGGRH